MLFAIIKPKHLLEVAISRDEVTAEKMRNAENAVSNYGYGRPRPSFDFAPKMLGHCPELCLFAARQGPNPLAVVT